MEKSFYILRLNSQIHLIDSLDSLFFLFFTLISAFFCLYLPVATRKTAFSLGQLRLLVMSKLFDKKSLLLNTGKKYWKLLIIEIMAEK